MTEWHKWWEIRKHLACRLCYVLYLNSRWNFVGFALSKCQQIESGHRYWALKLVLACPPFWMIDTPYWLEQGGTAEHHIVTGTHRPPWRACFFDPTVSLPLVFRLPSILNVGVMWSYDCAHVHHTTVTYFYAIPIENFMEFTTLREMLIQFLQELFTCIGWHYNYVGCWTK